MKQSKLEAIKAVIREGSFASMMPPTQRTVLCLNGRYFIGSTTVDQAGFEAWRAAIDPRDDVQVIREYTSNPGEVAEPVKDGIRLTAKQTEALRYLQDGITTEVLFGGGVGGGKSALGCYWTIKCALMYPGTRWLIGRAVLKTLKETTLVSFFEVAKMLGLKAGNQYKFNAQTSQIEFSNGSVILLKDLFAYPSDPNFDELGSLEITGAFIDECSQITEKAKNIVKSRIRFRLDEYGLLPKALYTTNPSKAWTYNDFYKPHREGTLQENRKFIQSLIGDNPHLSVHYRESLQSLDRNSRERLLNGSWEYLDDPSTLISYDRITDLFTNDFIEAGEGYITADIARFGSDRIVIGIWKGWRVRLYHYSKLSIKETSELIKDFAHVNQIPVSNIIVDADGVGGGAVDFIGCAGFVNNSRPLDNPVTREPENYVNLKSQCYFMLAQKINEAGMYIDCDDPDVKEMIIEELEQVKQYQMDKDGKRAVLPKDKVKENIGRSPDFSDTLMMRMWFGLCNRLTWVAF